MAHRPRLHRLPQRLDYTLIPAPLDLSLPLIAEKSALPAIIVTPSSPITPHDYSIAFLAPPEKPSLRARLTSYTTPFKNQFAFKARTMLMIFIIIFILVCHVVTHRLAVRRPHLEFSVQGTDAHLVENAPFANWFGFRSLWSDESASDGKGGEEFLVIDEPAAPTTPVHDPHRRRMQSHSSFLS